MPNGSGLSEEEYRVLNAFVSPMDKVINQFVESIDGKLDVGYHGMPDRRIDFKNTNDLCSSISISPRFIRSYGPTCLIDAFVYLDYETPDDSALAVVVNAMGTTRKWWHEIIANLTQMPSSPEDFVTFLNSAYDLIQSKVEEDLRSVY